LQTGKLDQKITASTNLIREVAWHPYLPILISASWDTKLSAISYEGGSDKVSFIQSYQDDLEEEDNGDYMDQVEEIEEEEEYFDEDDEEEEEEEDEDILDVL
jgi:hypothetical protein